MKPFTALIRGNSISKTTMYHIAVLITYLSHKVWVIQDVRNFRISLKTERKDDELCYSHSIHPFHLSYFNSDPFNPIPIYFSILLPIYLFINSLIYSSIYPIYPSINLSSHPFNPILIYLSILLPSAYSANH